jgi:hypothetical protein
MLILGLMKRNVGVVYAGVILAVLSRQTALLLIPATLLWIFKTSGWKELPLKQKVLHSSSITLIIVGTYILLGNIAERFSGPSANMDHMIGIFSYLSDSFSLAGLAEFFARAIIGFLFPLGMITAILLSQKNTNNKEMNLEFWILAFFAICICVQPVLAGPHVSGNSVTRLNMLGFVPTVAALAIKLRQTKTFTHTDPVAALLIGAVLFTSSCHHMYFFSGSIDGNTIYFVAIYILCALLMSGITWWTRREGNSTRKSSG